MRLRFDSDTLLRGSLRVVAFSTLAGLGLIAAFLFREGVPFLARYGLRSFLFSAQWDPGTGHFGVGAMVLASLWVTLGAMMVGVPLGVAGAVFLAEFADERMARLIKPTIELLAGIPSVLYGFIGVMVLAPWIRHHLGGPGLCLLAAALVLGIMILPTVMSIAMDALRAVPRTYREAALALGATRWQTVHMVVLKAARSGILAGVILAMGRAIGETMAVIMVAGNTVRIPSSPLDSVRTLTANIAMEMGYATGRHREALFATGVVLFGVIMALNTIALVILRRRGVRP